jgi:hypothetical protein
MQGTFLTRVAIRRTVLEPGHNGAAQEEDQGQPIGHVPVHFAPPGQDTPTLSRCRSSFGAIHDNGASDSPNEHRIPPTV